MIVKALVALALVSVPSTVAPAIPQLDQQVPKVVCPVYAGPLLIGFSMGTAFRVGPHMLLSVKHVTSAGDCYINFKKINVAWTSPDTDFSIISDEQTGPSLKIDCGGFVRGRKYEAIGHARGLDQLTTVELEGTGVKDGQFSVLKGILTVIPGQSGGPIIDAETGAVVGTINTYKMEQGLSGSVALRDTPLCKGAA